MTLLDIFSSIKYYCVPTFTSALTYILGLNKGASFGTCQTLVDAQKVPVFAYVYIEKGRNEIEFATPGTATQRATGDGYNPYGKVCKTTIFTKASSNRAA